ncbi:MAG TPA: hypothetical protein VHZ31_02190, partial [Solirubrobacteraceae bacterium]|nr:hypothetical protein [Solirubrobacteraceae bacterium]
RIAALERDLAAEREAAAAAREERDAVARRVAAERRAAAARLEQLSASERGARRELDGGARPFELDDDLPQVRLAYEPSAAGSDDGLDPAQVRHPYQPAAARRADGFLEPGFALEPDDDLAWSPGDDGAAVAPAHEPALLPPQRERISRRARRARRHPMERSGAARAATALAGLVVLLALGAGGYLVGHRDAGGPAAATSGLPEQATHAGVGLRYPAGWRPAARGPRLPGLDFTAPLVLAAGGASGAAGAGVVAGVVKDAVGSDLLPAGLRKRLPATAPKGEPVLLGDTQALRYAQLDVGGYADALTLYAVPTSDGSVVVACHAPAGSAAFFDDCARSAATLALDGLPSLRLDGARALPLGPSPSYGRRVATAIGTLDRAVRAGAAHLRQARTARGQATVARALAASVTRVASGLQAGSVSARDREGHDALVGAIRALGTRYGQLATAAADGSASAYGDAADGVRRADGRVRQAVRALATLGYGA